MLGAIVGDIVGSIYEGSNIRTPHFYPFLDAACRPTDDTVLTVAVADSLLRDADLVDTLKEYYRHYPYAGYGGNFQRWARSVSRAPYNSWGNGSAMRVSPVGWAYDTLEEVLSHAKRTAEVTHNHPEGIKGAQATAAAIFLARSGSGKGAIKTYIETTFGYNLSRTLDEIRPTYLFEVSCQRSVPESILAFLESDTFENAIRLGISLGGDSDTIACIAGGIAEAFYGEVPAPIRDEALPYLDRKQREVLDQFQARWGPGVAR